MKKRFISITLAVCIVCMCIPSAFARDAVTTDSKLDNLMMEMDNYLYAKQCDEESLKCIMDSYEEISGKTATKMYLFTRALYYTEQGKYAQAKSSVELLHKNTDFDEWIKENKDEYLCDTDALKQYINGREAENNDKIGTAVASYEKSITFFDARGRLDYLSDQVWSRNYEKAKEYIEEKDYAKAIELLTDLASVGYKMSDILLEEAKYSLGQGSTPTIKATAIPTPPQSSNTQSTDSQSTSAQSLVLTVKVNNGYNTLSWNALNNVKQYVIQRHKTDVSYTDVNITVDTGYDDVNVIDGFRYYYRIKALLNNGDYITSNEVMVVAKTKTTAKVTEYRYRDSTVGYTEWSSWSDWSTKQQSIYDSNLMQEESKQTYGWWAAKCGICGQHNPFWGSNRKCLSCGAVMDSSNYVWAGTTTGDVSGMTTIYGRSTGKYINGAAYWRAPDADKLQYRYKTRKTEVKWGSWSQWSTQKPSAASNREIEERTK